MKTFETVRAKCKQIAEEIEKMETFIAKNKARIATTTMARSAMVATAATTGLLPQTVALTHGSSASVRRA